jgi:predicted negative regulator of RcsB-dependent stress response
MTMPTAGKAVGGFIEAMRGMPLVLALCVMNGALIGFAYYQSHLFNSQRQQNVALFVQVQSEVQKLLSQCIVPPPARTQ